MTQLTKSVLREQNRRASELRQIRNRQKRREARRRIRQREYTRLRTMVPAVAQKTHVPKVTVIEEAIKYIDELHSALAERLQHTHGLATPEEGRRQLDQMVRQFLPFHLIMASGDGSPAGTESENLLAKSINNSSSDTTDAS